MSTKPTVLMAGSFAITLQFPESKDSIDGVFMGCDGFDYTQEVIQFREVTSEFWGKNGTAKGRSRLTKLPGNASGGNIILRRGMSISTSAWRWFDSVQKGDWYLQRKTISVDFYQHTTIQASFKFTEAWPTKYRIGEMKMDASNVQIEELEIAYEGFSRVETSPSS